MKKFIVVLVSLAMAAALGACGSSGSSAATTAAPETTKSAETTAAPAETTAAPAETKREEAASGAKYLTQVVTADFFGTDVDVTFTQDAEGTQFNFSYSFAGNDIDASGEIVDGVYTLAEDSSEFAVDAQYVVYAALTDTWEGDNGETVTQAPAKAPEKADTPASAAKGEYTKYQVIPIDMLGNSIDVTVSEDADGTIFKYVYEFNGNQIEVTGNIEPDGWVIVENPSGFGDAVLQDVQDSVDESAWKEF